MNGFGKRMGRLPGKCGKQFPVIFICSGRPKFIYHSRITGGYGTGFINYQYIEFAGFFEALCIFNQDAVFSAFAYSRL